MAPQPYRQPDYLSAKTLMSDRVTSPGGRPVMSHVPTLAGHFHCPRAFLVVWQGSRLSLLLLELL